MRKKSIYERALEEIDKQREAVSPLFKTISPERLQELKKQGLEMFKSTKRRRIRGPSSMPPNVRSGQMNPMDVVVDGASNRRFGRGGGRNIQLD